MTNRETPPGGGVDKASQTRGVTDRGRAQGLPDGLTDTDQVEDVMGRFAEKWNLMDPDEQEGWIAAVKADARHRQIQAVTEGTRDSAIAALEGKTEREPLIAFLGRIAEQSVEGEAPDSPWVQLASYLRAVAALLRGKEPPPVPADYADHLAAIQRTRQEG